MSDFRRLPGSTLVAAAFLLLLVICVIFDQRHWWDLRDDYLFGYLVPLFVGWVLFERWSLLRQTLVAPDEAGKDPALRAWAGKLEAKREAEAFPAWLRGLITAAAATAAVFGFLGVLMAAVYRAMEGPNLVTTQLLALSLVGLLLSAAYLFSDRRADGQSVPTRERIAMAGLLLFPALIWLLSAPMFNFLEKAISTFLLRQVATAVFFIFDVLGFSVIQEGNVIVLPKGEVGVEDACSGIRSLMACLFAGSFLAAVCLPVGFGQLWKKVVLVGAAMLFAFVVNIVRSLFLTAWAYGHGAESIGDQVRLFGFELGTVHDFTGFAVIVPVVSALLLLLPLFNLRLELPGDAVAERAAA